ncbi:ABC-type nitrate/sulfonate/bicarbonate transport system substrate-binding protein [Limnobacter thiooxidans]|uniref:ABC transporter substrate-binding protein n=1 Tax=Limnobacter thiooxidans TaxID=131080 RepID=A0AA86J4B2_9BURK|nr:ABC-type nitrate/sulfonate/bicarbonate transport system substrate-binding protein [Limnobacter thiooxidans]BET26994.1 ABC transporter substrate-binding protein [Limnobacter thiooxidans]
MANSLPSIWYTRCGAATASALAIHYGFLQQEFSQSEVNLLSLKDSDSLAIRNSHYNHTQSGMFREGGNIPPIWAKGLGQETVVLAITWLDEYQGILVRENSKYKSIHDLKGARLGIPRHEKALIDFQRGAAQHGFETALNLAGISTPEVRWVDIAHPSYDSSDGPAPVRVRDEHYRAPVLKALDDDLVDAVFLRFTSGVEAARDGRYRELININALDDPLLRVNNGTPRPVTVDCKFLDHHPDLVVRYLSVLIRTALWASQNPEAVLDQLNQDRSAEHRALIPLSHGSKVHESFFPKLNEQYITGLEVQKNFLRDWGYLVKDFDVREWIDPEPLQHALALAKSKPPLQLATALAA